MSQRIWFHCTSMKKYLELYDDFAHSVRYTEQILGYKLDEEALLDTMERISLAHYVVLSESEKCVLIENFKRGEMDVDKIDPKDIKRG